MPLPWPLRRTCSAAEPPPPPCAYRCSSRVRWQGIILLHRNATPFIVGIARLVAFLDHPAYRPHTPLVRKTLDGPETRPDRWFRRTKGGGRPSQVLCGPTGPNLAKSHQPTEAPHATTELSRYCRARRPSRHFEQTPSKTTPANHILYEEGSTVQRNIIKSGQFLIHGLSIWRDRPSINPKVFASFPLASFPTVCCRAAQRDCHKSVSQANPYVRPTCSATIFRIAVIARTEPRL